MSNIDLTGTVTGLNNGYAFVSTAKGTVFVSPAVFKLHSADLVIGAEVDMLVDDEVWNEKQQDYGLAALQIYEIFLPEVTPVYTRLKWFNPQKDGGVLSIIGESPFGDTLWVTKKVVDELGRKTGRKMPILANVIEVSGRATVVSIASGREIGDAIKALEAAAQLEVDAAPEGVADEVEFTEEDLTDPEIVAAAAAAMSGEGVSPPDLTVVPDTTSDVDKGDAEQADAA